ncbi:uncharacterized protein LOC108680321 [Hyalella azteca]|uniref:Uncharacterized protein LOC108680321 n=1 Tax=Hyalella azteca TaxID=294128 RepID=A0A8B7PEQ0_HYAAZ|nr:uncharacterized protein LOC108680321 [Hyalella azteca]
MVRRTSFQTVQPLDNPSYTDLDEISRCVHFDDFEEATRKQALVPQRLSNSHTRLRQQVLWFAPSNSSYEHNFYGNVSFTIKWETVLHKLGPNLYLIDQAIYNSRSYTRVVFTANNYDGTLKKVDLDSNDSPMTKSWSGFRYASYCKNKVKRGPHELQIAIEVDDADIKWLYLNCRAVANNHSDANTPSYGEHRRRDGKESNFQSYKCFKFNTAQNRECPYQWTQDECEEKIKMVLKTAVPASSLCRKRLVSDSAPKNHVRGLPNNVQSPQITSMLKRDLGEKSDWDSIVQQLVINPSSRKLNPINDSSPTRKQLSNSGVVAATTANVSPLKPPAPVAPTTRPKSAVQRNRTTVEQLPASLQSQPRYTHQVIPPERGTPRRPAPSRPVTDQPMLRSDIGINYPIASIYIPNDFAARRGGTQPSTNESRSRFRIFLDLICCSKQRVDSA